MPTDIRCAAGIAADLVFRADDDDLGIERLGERAGRDLGPDAARVAERDRDAGSGRHRLGAGVYVLTST